MKTPLAYHGGKTNMTPHILPLIPSHEVYIEPFVGGGAVFWSKPSSSVEIINDLDGRVVNFWRVLKDPALAAELSLLIQQTPASHQVYREAQAATDNAALSAVQRAWAFWFNSCWSFANKLSAGPQLGAHRPQGMPAKARGAIGFANRRDEFASLHPAYAARLRTVMIEHKPAVAVLAQHARADTFAYLDPPYINTTCGHYKDYTEEDYRALLDWCASTPAKFLLSSYHTPILSEYVARRGWQQRAITRAAQLAAHKGTFSADTRTEVLTYNFESPAQSLF